MLFYIVHNLLYLGVCGSMCSAHWMCKIVKIFPTFTRLRCAELSGKEVVERRVLMRHPVQPNEPNDQGSRGSLEVQLNIL